MPDYTELAKVIKTLAKEQNDADSPATVCTGTVVSASPLSVQVDQRFTISAGNLIIPQHLTNYTVSAAGSTASSDGHTHTISSITINNALKAGDKVVLIRQAGGQKYLIIDRAV